LALRKTWRASRPVKRVRCLSGQLNKDVGSILNASPKNRKKATEVTEIWKNKGYIIIPFLKPFISYLCHSLFQKEKIFHKRARKGSKDGCNFSQTKKLESLGLCFRKKEDIIASE
jgi:hypothetical protein